MTGQNRAVRVRSCAKRTYVAEGAGEIVRVLTIPNADCGTRNTEVTANGNGTSRQAAKAPRTAERRQTPAVGARHASPVHVHRYPGRAAGPRAWKAQPQAPGAPRGSHGLTNRIAGAPRPSRTAGRALAVADISGQSTQVRLAEWRWFDRDTPPFRWAGGTAPNWIKSRIPRHPEPWWAAHRPA